MSCRELLARENKKCQYRNLSEIDKEIFVKEFYDLLQDTFFSSFDISLFIKNLLSFSINNSMTIDKNDKNKNDIIHDVRRMKKKKKKKKKDDEKRKDDDLSNLSPNVIIYHILPYFNLKSTKIMKYSSSSNKLNKLDKYKYGLFGYFSRDKLRNIWFLFNSITLKTKINDDGRSSMKGFYVSFKRLMFLKVLRANWFLKKFVNVEYKNLEILEINNHDDDDFGDINLYNVHNNNNNSISLSSILKNNKFNCNKFKSIFYFREIKNTEIVDCDLKGIEKFQIVFYNENGIIKSLGDTKKLKYLRLNDVSYDNNKNWGDFSNVEVLEIEFCSTQLDEFFRNHPFQNLKKLQIDKCHLDNWKMVRNSFTRLEQIDIKNCEDFSDMFFQRNCFDKVEKMILQRMPIITGKKWFSFKNLKTFHIHGCGFETEFFSRMELMEKMESFVCTLCPQIENVVFSKHIERIIVDGIKKKLNRLVLIIRKNLTKVYKLLPLMNKIAPTTKKKDMTHFEISGFVYDNKKIKEMLIDSLDTSPFDLTYGLFNPPRRRANNHGIMNFINKNYIELFRQLDKISDIQLLDNDIDRMESFILENLK